MIFFKNSYVLALPLQGHIQCLVDVTDSLNHPRLDGWDLRVFASKRTPVFALSVQPSRSKTEIQVIIETQHRYVACPGEFFAIESEYGRFGLHAEDSKELWWRSKLAQISKSTTSRSHPLSRSSMSAHWLLQVFSKWTLEMKELTMTQFVQTATMSLPSSKNLAAPASDGFCLSASSAPP